MTLEHHSNSSYRSAAAHYIYPCWISVLLKLPSLCISCSAHYTTIRISCRSMLNTIGCFHNLHGSTRHDWLMKVLLSNLFSVIPAPKISTMDMLLGFVQRLCCLHNCNGLQCIQQQSSSVCRRNMLTCMTCMWMAMSIHSLKTTELKECAVD